MNPECQDRSGTVRIDKDSDRGCQDQSGSVKIDQDWSRLIRIGQD